MKGWNNMTFYDYVTKYYIEEATPRGDLARDMKSDAGFPRLDTVNKGTKRVYKDYLRSKGACRECVAVCGELFDEYAGGEKNGRE